MGENLQGSRGLKRATVINMKIENLQESRGLKRATVINMKIEYPIVVLISFLCISLNYKFEAS